MRNPKLWEGIMWATLTFFTATALPQYLNKTSAAPCDITIHSNFTYTAGTGAQTPNCTPPPNMLLHANKTWEWVPPTP